MQTYELFKKGSTGTGRQYVRNMWDADKIAVEFEIEAVGATPNVSWNVQGLVPGGDPAVAAHWVNLALVQADSTVAASNAAVTGNAVGKTFRFVDGQAFDDRFFDAIAVNINSNTNVTFSVRLHRQDKR